MTADKNIIRYMIEQAIHNALGYEDGFDFEKRIHWGVSVEDGREVYSEYTMGGFIDYRLDVAIDMKALQAAIAASPVFDREAKAAAVAQEVERICKAFELAA